MEGKQEKGRKKARGERVMGRKMKEKGKEIKEES